MIDSEAVALIQSLEPMFFEAGQLAVDLQRGAISSMKGESGRVAIDKKDREQTAKLECEELA